MGELESVQRDRVSEHVRDLLEDYLAGRLGSEAEVAFEAHLLVCDRCFSAYLVRTLDDLG